MRAAKCRPYIVVYSIAVTTSVIAPVIASHDPQSYAGRNNVGAASCRPRFRHPVIAPATPVITGLTRNPMPRDINSSEI